METISLPDYYDSVFLRYPVLVKNKTALLRKAQRNRIEIGDWFLSPIHPNLEGWEKVDYKEGMCPIAEKTCNHIINLPTHNKIDEQEAKRIIDFIILEI